MPDINPERSNYNIGGHAAPLPNTATAGNVASPVSEYLTYGQWELLFHIFCGILIFALHAASLSLYGSSLSIIGICFVFQSFLSVALLVPLLRFWAPSRYLTKLKYYYSNSSSRNAILLILLIDITNFATPYQSLKAILPISLIFVFALILHQILEDYCWLYKLFCSDVETAQTYLSTLYGKNPGAHKRLLSRSSSTQPAPEHVLIFDVQIDALIERMEGFRRK